MIPEKNLFARFRVINGNYYITDGKQVFQLDEVGLKIWELVDGTNDVEEISEQISEQFSVKKEMVLEDTHEFITQLNKANLVKIS